MPEPLPSPFFQDRATLYAAGQLAEEERETFELLLRCDGELSAFTASLMEVTAPLGARFSAVNPPARLRERVLEAARAVVQDEVESLVRSNARGEVEWVSPEFSEMCGYSLAELRGKRLGPLLQGEKTERGAAERLGRAVGEAVPCREVILNYHKNGRPYWVDIAITPIIDDEGKVHCLIAQEREVTERPLP